MKSEKEIILEALEGAGITPKIADYLTRRILDTFVLYNAQLIDDETLRRLGFYDKKEEE